MDRDTYVITGVDSADEKPVTVTNLFLIHDLTANRPRCSSPA
jgi:hypothetical protein